MIKSIRVPISFQELPSLTINFSLCHELTIYMGLYYISDYHSTLSKHFADLFTLYSC